MQKVYILCCTFVHLLTLVHGADKVSCAPQNSACSANKKCCSISNGKTYCNPKTGLCEALRYCDPSDPKKCPFNDLSADEIRNVMKIVQESGKFGAKLHFSIVRQKEPKKKLWNSGNVDAMERKAYVAVFDLDQNLLSEVLVSLTKQRVISVTPRPNSVGPVTPYEYETATKVLENDSRIKLAYARRGLNVSNAAFDIWAFGSDVLNNVVGRRRVELVFNYKDPATKYMDWSPVEGLSATIDIASKKIVKFSDKGNIPVPKPPCFTELKSRVTSSAQPKSTIQVKGYQIKWQNWKLQYSIDPIHGLQLYHIRYFADGEERFLIYKISASEMYVPYGASGETWRWRGAFDAGEYGLGKTAASLALGVDVPLNSQLFSCPQLDADTAEVTALEGCFAVFERDASPGYKHYDRDSEATSAIAGSEMVLAFMCTVGNYDYVFHIIFSMDGNINVRTYATGLLLSRAVPQKLNDPNCIEDCQDFVNTNLISPVHQHFLSYRIDFDVDGTNNMLTEVDFVKDPEGPDNLDGGAFSLRRTIIRKETFRDTSAANARFWSVINVHSRNKFNSPRGYSLHPTSLGWTFLKPGSSKEARAMFIKHPVWITAYKDDEQTAAGVFPRSSTPDQGLPTYIKNAESLEDRDIVVWHTFAVTHAPRPEEFPIMNSMYAGFNIISRNFQSYNPNVDQCHDKKG